MAHKDSVPADSLKFFWSHHCNSPAHNCTAHDGNKMPGSFSHLIFKSAEQAELELINHHGDVMYSLEKTNPRSGGTWTPTDRTIVGVATKVYPPYRKPVGVVPPAAQSGGHLIPSEEEMFGIAMGGVLLAALLLYCVCAKRSNKKKSDKFAIQKELGVGQWAPQGIYHASKDDLAL
jgi:hypothetical protein